MAEELTSRRVKMETDLGVGQDAAAAGEGGRSDDEISVKIDSEVLRCTICLEFLKPPVFMCEAGHVLCSVCMEKLREVGNALKLDIFCDPCCKNTSYCRCVEVEQFIDAVKVTCSYEIHGCNEVITYHEKKKHESGCTHAPWYCPENECTFRGATCCLLDHFGSAHGWSPTNFSFNKPLKISVAHGHRFTLLIGEDQSMFLLTNTLPKIGNALTMFCVKPHESEPNYSCNISAAHVVASRKAEGWLLFLKDPLVSSRSLLGGVQLGKFFLLVPLELAESSSGELLVHVRIGRLRLTDLS